VAVQFCTARHSPSADVYCPHIGSTEGRLPVVSTGVLVLMRSACKVMMFGGASVEGGRKVKLCCCVQHVAADVSRGPNGLMSRGNWHLEATALGHIVTDRLIS
jgi:hypothetical protein